MQQVNFKRWGNQLVDQKAEKLLVFENDKRFYCPCSVHRGKWSVADSNAVPGLPH